MSTNNNQRHFRKSTRSGGSGGNCVEWAHTPEGVYIRDSKDPDGLELLATLAEWKALVAAVAAGQPHPWVSPDPAGVVLRNDGRRLTFTLAEWTAFQDGVRVGEGEPAYASE